MTQPRNRKPLRLSVQSSFRVFLYLGFALCVSSTIAILGWGGSWWAPMFGTVAFGLPAVVAYLTEQEQQHARNLAAEMRNQRGGEGGWDLNDDDSGDPTVPPPPRQRTR